MRTLRGIAWRGLARRRLRSVLTILGIALGVGLLLAALAVDAGVDAASARTVEGTAGRSDLAIAALDDRGLSPATLAGVRATDGVADALGSVSRSTFGSSLAHGALGRVLVLGFDPAAVPPMHDVALASGAGLDGPAPSQAASTPPSGSPALPAGAQPAPLLVAGRWAADHGLAIGDRVSLDGAGGTRPFVVTGILASSGLALAEGGRVAITTLGAAQTLFGLGDRVDRIEVRARGGTAVPDLVTRLEAALRVEPYVLATTSEQIVQLDDSTRDFRSSTVLVAAIALFVGGFLVFNTLSMTVAERVRDVGLLRAAGATRGQVLRLFLVEAILLGIAGTLLGLVIGVALAAVMAGFVASIESIPAGDPVLAPGPIVTAAVLGLLVTVVGAIEPAWRAARIPPVEALRARGSGGLATGARLAWFAAVAAVLGVASIVALPSRDGGTAGVARPIVVFVLLFAAAAIASFALTPLARIATVAFRRVFRAEGRLALGGLVRERGRTAVTLGALTVSLAMVVAVSTLAQTARHAGTAWLESVVPGDYVATSVAPVPTDIGAELKAVPGVASVTPVRTFAVDASGLRLDAMGIDPLAFADAGSLSVVAGDRGAAFAELVSGGSVLVPSSIQASIGVHVGDTMAIRGPTENVAFRVAAIVARSLPGTDGESLVFSNADAERLLGAPGASFFAIRAMPGAPASLRTALDGVAAKYALEVANRDEIGGSITSSLDRVFGLLDALALVAVLVAALGIVNTLTMDVYERVREIGVLRAAGMTRSQIWRMVALEAGILGLGGAVMGVVAGLVVGGVMSGLSASSGFQPGLEVPWPTVVAALLLGVCVATLAAAYPARLASRLGVVRAVSFE